MDRSRGPCTRRRRHGRARRHRSARERTRGRGCRSGGSLGAPARRSGAPGVAGLRAGEEGLELRLDHAVEDALLGPPACVGGLWAVGAKTVRMAKGGSLGAHPDGRLPAPYPLPGGWRTRLGARCAETEHVRSRFRRQQPATARRASSHRDACRALHVSRPSRWGIFGVSRRRSALCFRGAETGS